MAEANESRPCVRRECDLHSEHPPCDLGWISADRVCPCWSARRRVEVHYSGPAPSREGVPMPAGVRAAFHAAQKAARPVPAVPEAPTRVPTPRPAAPGAAARPEPDPVPDAVLDRLPASGHTITVAQRAQLLDALGTARAAGWIDTALTSLLEANTDPDRSPVRLWLRVLQRNALDAPRTACEAAA